MVGYVAFIEIQFHCLLKISVAYYVFVTHYIYILVYGQGYAKHNGHGTTNTCACGELQHIRSI